MRIRNWVDGSAGNSNRQVIYKRIFGTRPSKYDPRFTHLENMLVSATIIRSVTSDGDFYSVAFLRSNGVETIIVVVFLHLFGIYDVFE